MKHPCLALVAALALAALGAAIPAAAQRLGTIGVGGGVAALPAIFAPSCGGGTAGDVAGRYEEVRAVIPLRGPLAVEGAMGVYTPLGSRVCVVMLPPPPEGISAHKDYPWDGGTSVASDLRLAYRPSALFAVAAGAGWLWGPQAPYLALSPELRTPAGTAHVLLAGDLALGWFPYDLVLTEFRSQMPIREVSRASTHEWRSIVGFRAGIQLDVR